MPTDALITNDQSQESEVCAPFGFLLSCSDTSFDNLELAKLSEAANLRSQLHRVLDELRGLSSTLSLSGALLFTLACRSVPSEIPCDQRA